MKPHPVIRTDSVCVNCEKPIQPGQLYAVLNVGPCHFGCQLPSTLDRERS